MLGLADRGHALSLRHRSHFGSRYDLGCCDFASLLLLVFAIPPKPARSSSSAFPLPPHPSAIEFPVGWRGEGRRPELEREREREGRRPPSVREGQWGFVKQKVFFLATFSPPLRERFSPNAEKRSRKKVRASCFCYTSPTLLAPTNYSFDRPLYNFGILTLYEAGGGHPKQTRPAPVSTALQRRPFTRKPPRSYNNFDRTKLS